MKIHTRRLPEGLVYPCTPAELRDLFPDGIVDNLAFDIFPKDRLEPQNGNDLFQGPVLLRACEPYWVPWTEYPPFFTIYAVEETRMTRQLHDMLLDVLKGSVRAWAQSVKSAHAADRPGRSSLYVELRNGNLQLHQFRCK